MPPVAVAGARQLSLPRRPGTRLRCSAPTVRPEQAPAAPAMGALAPEGAASASAAPPAARTAPIEQIGRLIEEASR